MKKYIIIFMLLLVHLLQAQIPDISFWNNIRNSSYTIDNNIHIRCETLELPELETEIFYTTQEGWASQEMQQFTGFTYEAIIPAIPDDTQYCRFRTEADTLVGMMPAYLPDDVFPPEISELSFVASDAAGDVLDPELPNLDITGNYFGYSDTRFYGGITNDTGTFPLDNGGMFPTMFYFYVTTIINPETVLIDSVVYAMIYADIPYLLSPGLYRITGTEFSLETFELIGNIEAQVVDTMLVMACDIETLTNDEYFGDWPNLTNSLGVEMLTASYSITLEFLITDLSKPSLHKFDPYVIEPFENILPELSDAGFSAGTGVTEFYCTYYDENSHFPVISEIEVEGSIYSMLPTLFDYSAPVDFFTEIPVINWEEATFRFSDNGYEFVEEIIINNSSSDEELPIANCTLQNYPNPFNPTTTISFSVPQNSDFVNLEIYNIKGQKVKDLSPSLCHAEPVEVRGKTKYSVVWNGTDDNNQPVSSGIYLYQLKVDGKPVAKKRCLLLK